jgi:hypothetical protein
MDAMLATIDAELAAHARWSDAAREREEAAEAALLERGRELASASKEGLANQQRPGNERRSAKPS